MADFRAFGRHQCVTQPLKSQRDVEVLMIGIARGIAEGFIESDLFQGFGSKADWKPVIYGTRLSFMSSTVTRYSPSRCFRDQAKGCGQK